MDQGRAERRRRSSAIRRPPPTTRCASTTGGGRCCSRRTCRPARSKWSAIGDKGYKYKDQTGAEDGITKIIVKGGDAGKSKALVKGKGVNLPDFDSDLPIAMGDLPLVVQLRNNASGICWEGSFASSEEEPARSVQRQDALISRCMIDPTPRCVRAPGRLVLGLRVSDGKGCAGTIVDDSRFTVCRRPWYRGSGDNSQHVATGGRLMLSRRTFVGRLAVGAAVAGTVSTIGGRRAEARTPAGARRRAAGWGAADGEGTRGGECRRAAGARGGRRGGAVGVADATDGGRRSRPRLAAGGAERGGSGRVRAHRAACERSHAAGARLPPRR